MWPETVGRRVAEYGVTARLRVVSGHVPGRLVMDATGPPPPRIERRLMDGARAPEPPPPRHPERRPPDGMPRQEPPPRDRSDPPPPPERRFGPPPALPKEVRPLFLVKDADAYWAGLALPLPDGGSGPPRLALLLLRSEKAAAGGLFFDYAPWLWGGLAVLGVSLALWAPFVAGITRYASRLSAATGRIADGDFETRIGAARRDELGLVGASIERMAGRLGDHAARQKRFMADVAHELCAPVARIRTGLGVLEHALSAEHKPRLESIDEDAAELSALLSELLEFTRAGTAAARVELENLDLRDLVAEAADREGVAVALRVGENVTVRGDRSLLARAVRNVFRNSRRHAGENCRITAAARAISGKIELTIDDDGPGVPDDELARIFEPFYRPDRARTREAGGVGLGLSIVAASVRACGGEVAAARAATSGLRIIITLPEG
jgi:two-component system sensor histidine kinase CpxA